MPRHAGARSGGSHASRMHHKCSAGFWRRLVGLRDQVHLRCSNHCLQCFMHSASCAETLRHKGLHCTMPELLQNTVRRLRCREARCELAEPRQHQAVHGLIILALLPTRIIELQVALEISHQALDNPDEFVPLFHSLLVGLARKVRLLALRPAQAVKQRAVGAHRDVEGGVGPRLPGRRGWDAGLRDGHGRLRLLGRPLPLGAIIVHLLEVRQPDTV
mmetsp:Transcript_64655/g.183524  ORF Transcript_64655/g.183524 Transcript_64655/m.183524 type:complete len:217 (+) Transcript_64655:239-889(+)